MYSVGREDYVWGRNHVPWAKNIECDLTLFGKHISLTLDVLNSYTSLVYHKSVENITNTTHHTFYVSQYFEVSPHRSLPSQIGRYFGKHERERRFWVGEQQGWVSIDGPYLPPIG